MIEQFFVMYCKFYCQKESSLTYLLTQSAATVQPVKRLEVVIKSVQMELLMLIQNQFMQPARVQVMLALRKYVHRWIFHSQ